MDGEKLYAIWLAGYPVGFKDGGWRYITEEAKTAWNALAQRLDAPIVQQLERSSPIDLNVGKVTKIIIEYK